MRFLFSYFNNLIYIPHAWKVLVTVFCQFYLLSKFPFLDMSSLSFIFLKHLSESLKCWERLKVGEEEDDRGWDGCMASPTQWTWVWLNSKCWWWTGRPGMLQSMRWQSWTWLSEWNELTVFRVWYLVIVCLELITIVSYRIVWSHQVDCQFLEFREFLYF